MTDFILHEKLKADAIELARLDLTLLLLMNARQWPWLILVPQRPDVREIHELPALDRTILMDEVAHCSRLLTDLFKPDKINIGALGNIVPQLHVHVIARTTDRPRLAEAGLGHGGAGAVWGRRTRGAAPELSATHSRREENHHRWHRGAHVQFFLSPSVLGGIRQS